MSPSVSRNNEPQSPARPSSKSGSPAAENQPVRSTVRRTAAAGVVGSIIEYYDFTLFGLAAAVVFGPLFFPSQNPTAQTISSLLTFAIGYLGRPIGGLLFSHYGDRFGRKPMLMTTLILMGLSTMAIGFLPTYRSIGVLAPILLAVCRIAQGMGAGAEYVGSMVMMAEAGDRRGFGLRVSLPGSGVFAGIVIATAVYTLVAGLPQEALFSWGWRVPFFASAITIGVGIWIRSRVDETAEFKRVAAAGAVRRIPALHAIRDQWQQILVGWAIVAPYLAFSTLSQVYLLSYLTKTVGLPSSTGLLANLVSSTVAIATVPLFGWLCDRVGRVTVWVFGTAVFVVFGTAVFPVLHTGSTWAIALIMVLGIGVGLAATYAAQGSLLSGLFVPEHRLSGIVLVREPMSALVGGPIAAFAAWLAMLAGGASYPVTLIFIAASLIGATTAVCARKRFSAGFASRTEQSAQ